MTSEPGISDSDFSHQQTNDEDKLSFTSLDTATARITAEAQSMMQRRAPTFASRGTQDVTANFVAASKQLKPGELVKDEYFTLFEAVGALEIMDPKMDSGYVEPDDSFEPEYQVDVEEPSPAETLWIMDEIMRLEVLFHEGYPLSQNVFTSLHIFKLIDPNNVYPYPMASSMRRLSLTQQILRVYCLAVIKSCQLLLECIQSQTFYEEEDFVTYLFGRELCPKMDEQEVVGMLSDMVSRLLRFDDGDKAVFGQDFADALSQRLEIRENFLRGLGQSPDLEQAGLLWHQLRGRIETLTESRSLARSLPAAFSFKVQRQLASSTPPRPMPEISWEEAQHKWIHLCDDVLAAYDLTAAEKVRSPHLLISGVWSFSYRTPAPATYARAKLQELLTSDDKVGSEVSHFDLMLEDIRELVLPQDPLAQQESFLIEAPHNVRHRTSRIMEEFMTKAFGEYLNIYRMLCQNRDRMRRLITQAIPIFDELEVLALEYDDHIMKTDSPRFTTAAKSEVYYPLWMWTRIHKLRLVQWAIQLGFETDLYQDVGVQQMYDVLASIFAQEDRSMRTVISSAMHQAKASTRRRQPANGDLDDSVIWLYSLQQEYHVHQSLALVLTTLWEFLDELGLLASAKDRPYYDEQRQYEARMKPLLKMQHQVATTMEDLRAVKSSRATGLCSAVQLQEQLELVMGFAKGASQEETVLARIKQLKAASSQDDLLRQQELKRLEATCWTIKIVLGQLASICKKHGKEQEACGKYTLRGVVRAEVPEVKDRKHPWWVVPKIVEIAR
ncbi:Putative alpha-acetyltransferase 35, NatC auxiliary subunit [Septoria linicola]|uniref:Alpha-acetyltransferase 35, NatC auxiliary subunit n=1 Tax=Septoria linicola TaxID=215465 RepID=A0A9Q9EL34_9PEZI|nr:putative alpha-acetyltransferase 35, NatC auxiliary subunit [Septoria linicola]USW53013.1 Putative alpha-acetyltransferase 35, NatC auxiliary subunit [Septoria linicola]